MSIKDCLVRDIVKTAYAEGSLSGLLESDVSGDALYEAIQDKIKEYRQAGNLTDGRFLEKILPVGPHTRLGGSGILALAAKAINSVRPGTVNYELTPEISMSHVTGADMIGDYANLSDKYYDKVHPGTSKKLYDTVAAHEILEAEAMKENMPGLTNIVGGTSVGALLGAAAMSAPILDAVNDYKKGKLDISTVANALQSVMTGGVYGGLGGGLLGRAYNYIRDIPDMSRWSSHMSADIPRLESVMVDKLQDPALTEIFKALRTSTGERRAIQEAALKDYGENIPGKLTDDIQKIDPMKYLRL